MVNTMSIRRFYAPLILILIILSVAGIFITNALSDRQNQNHLEAFEHLQKDVAQAVQDLKDDNAKQTEELIKQTDLINQQQRLIECILLAHGIEDTLTDEGIEHCRQEAMKAQSTSPAPPTPNGSSNTNMGQGTSQSNQPEQPQQPPQPPPTVFDTLETTVCGRVGIIIRCEEI